MRVIQYGFSVRWLAKVCTLHAYRVPCIDNYCILYNPCIFIIDFDFKLLLFSVALML